MCLALAKGVHGARVCTAMNFHLGLNAGTHFEGSEDLSGSERGVAKTIKHIFELISRCVLELFTLVSLAICS